jgi:Ser/Thr protein kinase RdoA (MazF antagonist)
LTDSQTFFDLPQEDQIKELELFARVILQEYPVEILDVKCINFDYNATMKVSVKNGSSYALRINIYSPRTSENLKAEIAWVRLLAQEGRISVPVPIGNREGNFHTSIFHEPSQRTLYCVLYSWLEGEELGDEPTVEQLKKLGAAMAQLHLSTKTFELPEGCSLPSLKDPMWESEDFLLSARSVLNPDARELIGQAMDLIRDETERLFTLSTPQVIHADLHGWNVMWHEDEVSVFDFDDCGIGIPLQDLATALYYLDTPEQGEALKEGYASVIPLPDHSSRDMEMLLLQRRIILLNFLHETSNKEHRAMIPEYQEETLRRIKNFLNL